MQSSLAELRARPHTSISAIKTFLQCPRRYRLQYVDRIPPAFRSAFFAFGTAWHDVIDHWLTSDATQPTVSAFVIISLQR